MRRQPPARREAMQGEGTEALAPYAAVTARRKREKQLVGANLHSLPHTEVMEMARNQGVEEEVSPLRATAALCSQGVLKPTAAMQ